MNWTNQNSSALEGVKSIFPVEVHDLEILTRTRKSKILVLLNENSSEKWIILKTREIWHEHIITNFIYEIAFLAYLWKNFPQFHNQIPRLYWIVRNSQGQVAGIVMEKFPWDVSKYSQVWLYTFEDEEIIRKLKENWFDDELLNSLEFSLFKWWNWDTFIEKIWDTEDVWRELAKDNNKTRIRRLLRRYAWLLLHHPELYSIDIDIK